MATQVPSVHRALPVLLLSLSILLPATMVLPAARSEDTTGGFGMECLFGPSGLFPGESRIVAINLTNLMQYDALVRAVGIQFDWMGSHQHCYAGCETEPLKLSPGGSGLFSPSFDVPADAPAVNHTYHVCVEYQLNRSGNLKDDTWMSDTRGDLRVVDFGLSADPAELAVLAGASVAFNLSVRALNGFIGNVELSFAGPLPQNGTYRCLFADSNLCWPGGPARILVETDRSCPDSRYTLAVEGACKGFWRAAALTLVVQPPPDFALNITPSKARLTAGEARMFRITVLGHPNLTDNISLSARDRPAGCSVLIFAKAIRVGESARMEVRAGPDAPADLGHVLLVEGRSARYLATGQSTLAVEPRPTAPGLWISLALMILVAAAIALFAVARRRRRPNAGA